MSKEIIWSSEAEKDLASILDYLEHKWNFRTANAFLDILDKNITHISNHPEQFPIFKKSENV